MPETRIELINIYGIFITSIFTFLIALYTLQKTEQSHKKREYSAHQERLKATLKALKAELIALKNRIKKAGLEDLKTNTSGTFFKATQNYFSVYENNIALLGSLKNDDLQVEITTTYINLKGYLDTLLTLNKLNEEVFLLEINLHNYREQLAKRKPAIDEYTEYSEEETKHAITSIDTLLQKITYELKKPYV